MSRTNTIPKWCAQAKREGVKWRLHPLIYTRLEFTPAQDIGGNSAHKKAPTD